MLGIHDRRGLVLNFQYTTTVKSVAALVATGLAAASMLMTPLGGAARAENATPTPEEYVQQAGEESLLLAPGQFVLDGLKQTCGQRPVVIDNKLDDYGAAYPGFLIMNPKLLSRVSTPVKQWIFAHECGHQFRGPDEETADCFAVQRGRRQGWLTDAGVEEICTFISPAKGDAMHFSGSHRCEYMRKCYADPKVR